VDSCHIQGEEFEKKTEKIIMFATGNIDEMPVPIAPIQSTPI
jgi:hypothetical protein